MDKKMNMSLGVNKFSVFFFFYGLKMLSEIVEVTQKIVNKLEIFAP